MTRWVAVIPARGGSERAPGKNLRPWRGRPLLAWAIDCALEAGASEARVSSDDDDILELAAACGALPIRRPAAISGADARVAPAIHHATPDHDAWAAVAVLQPTSPERTAEQVRGAVAALLAHRAARSAVAARQVPVHRRKLLALEGELLLPLGDPETSAPSPPIVTATGAVYVVRGRHLQRGTLFVPPVLYLPDRHQLDVDHLEQLG